MTIGAISFQPYVYNVNAIGPASMNKLSRISDNVLDKKIEYEKIAENENPLKKGQTLDFQGMLEMQMQRGRSNAARMMKPAQEQDEAATVKFERGGSVDALRDARTADTQQAQEAEENAQKALAAAGLDRNGGVSNFRMQQAINAYEMFMTA